MLLLTLQVGQGGLAAHEAGASQRAFGSESTMPGESSAEQRSRHFDGVDSNVGEPIACSTVRIRGGRRLRVFQRAAGSSALKALILMLGWNLGRSFGRSGAKRAWGSFLNFVIGPTTPLASLASGLLIAVTELRSVPGFSLDLSATSATFQAFILLSSHI